MKTNYLKIDYVKKILDALDDETREDAENLIINSLTVPKIMPWSGPFQGRLEITSSIFDKCKGKIIGTIKVYIGI